MENEIRFNTELDGGFHLPTAYKSHDGQLKQLVAITTLIAGIACAAVLAPILFG